MRGRRAIVALLFTAVAVAGSALSVSATPADLFPRYPELEPNVAFWRDAFAKHTKHNIILHDPYHLDVVYVVGDVSNIIRGDGTDAYSQKAIRAYISEETARIARVLRRMDPARPRGYEEEHLVKVLRAARGSLPPGDVLAARIRSQRGLANELCGAVERARMHLPEMKQILAANGVPAELSSLPLVESSYRTNARSFVGAAGIWQFTNGTGRRYLRIDHVVDERRDPLTATEAAARYLRSNYEMLGSWPLAITGYNHGEAGVARAVRELGTTDLGVIVQNYQGRSFGFASRNFYAEFLAAHDVMARADEYCGTAAPARPERVQIGAYVPLSELASCAGVDTATLLDLNPALQAPVREGKLHVPKGYRLNLPSGRKTPFEKAYAALPSSVIYGGQAPYYASHRVRSGQTLGQIARMYRTSVSALQQHNGIRNARLIRVGQVLRIPVAGMGKTVASASKSAPTRSSASPARATTYVIHRVASGQTLSHIARRYGVSSTEIQRFNTISDPRSLRAGQKIKIPATAKQGPTFRTHRVASGQTLSHIARLYRTSVSILQDFNGISDPAKLRQGQVIRVPM